MKNSELVDLLNAMMEKSMAISKDFEKHGNAVSADLYRKEANAYHEVITILTDARFREAMVGLYLGNAN